MRDRAARTVKLISCTYLEVDRLTTQLVETYGLNDCKTKSVPLYRPRYDMNSFAAFVMTLVHQPNDCDQ